MLSSQANIFKSDFLEERRDREKAKGDLDTVKREMWHKDAMFQQEMAGLTETINVMKQEHKRELVRVEAKYQERISTSKVTVQALKSKVQEISAGKVMIGRTMLSKRRKLWWINQKKLPN